MKRQRLAVFVFWASLVLLVVCSSLAVNRPRRVSTGIPGEAVTLGMGVDEVLRAAGMGDLPNLAVCTVFGMVLYLAALQAQGVPFSGIFRRK